MKSIPLTIHEVLTRQVEKVLPSRNGLESLMRKKKIRLYLGVDPTGRSLHLGHTIVLRKLEQFAKLGHEAILVVGTGTVLAGDPSQRAVARARITRKEITENIKTWEKQVSKVVDFSNIKIRRNGEWLSRLRLPQILDIASYVSASQLFQRDMFQARLGRGDTVWTHELLYPLLQGYDSVAMDVDLEIGGTDQLFNMLVGRELQKKMRSKEKYVLCVPMLLGLDGKQMSKTSGNTINISDPPQEMYGKIMSMKDELIPHYFELCTEVPIAEVKKLAKGLKSAIIFPRDAKTKLAREIVSLYHGFKAAQKAEQEFHRIFREKQLPSHMPRVAVKAQELSLLDLITQTGLAHSKAEARRLVEQRGVKIDGETQENWRATVKVQEGMVVRAGKRRFIEIAQ